MPGLGVYVPAIKLGGSKLSEKAADALVDVRVTQDLHAPSMATVRFDDPYFELLDGSLVSIGGAMTVAFPKSSGADKKVFDGIVTAVGSEQGAGDRHELVVTAYDRSHALAHTTTAMSYTDMTVSDIVSRIARRHGLSAKASAARMKLEYFLQVDTDHAVLDQLAALCGMEWWVVDKTLNFAKRTMGTPVALQWGKSLVRLSARFTGAARAATVDVRGWDPATQKAVVGTVSRTSVSKSDTGLDLTLGTRRSSQASSLKGKVVVTEQPVSSAAEAKSLAEATAAELAAGELRIRGEAMAEPDITAGGSVKISKAGTQMSGTFVVTRVEHSFGSGRPLVARFEAGRLRPGGVADRLLAVERAQRTAQRTFAIGTVTNANDPEKAGRVKVKLPMVSDKDESAWARVVSVSAGKGYGMEFMPEVGDEVLLGYIGADPRYPVVLGALWSKKNTPPEPQPVANGAVAKRVIKAKSGARLTFVEGDAKKAVVELVHAAADTKVVLDDKGVSIAAKKGSTISLKVGSASVTLESDGTISVKGGAVTVKADGNLTLQGQKVTVKGQTGVTIDGGGAKVDLSPGGAKVESSAITQIKGALVKLN